MMLLWAMLGLVCNPSFIDPTDAPETRPQWAPKPPPSGGPVAACDFGFYLVLSEEGSGFFILNSAVSRCSPSRMVAVVLEAPTSISTEVPASSSCAPDRQIPFATGLNIGRKIGFRMYRLVGRGSITPPRLHGRL